MAETTSQKRHLGITSSTLVSTSDVTIGGNLTVEGTTVTLNAATLEVEDKNILVNKGGTKASADGAGLTIYRGTSTAQTLSWNDANSRFEFSHPLKVATSLYVTGALYKTDANQVDIETPHGTVQIGAMNEHHGHIYTDRPSFYINKPLLIQGNTALTTANTIATDKLPGGVFQTRSTTVGKDTDWDTLTSQGTYGVASSAGAQFEGNNAPKTSDYRYGHVVVTEDDGQGIRQTYYPHSGKKIFTRTGWSNGSWYSGGWHEHWTSLNHPTTISGYGITDTLAPSDAEKNVQVDWNETTTTSDSFIKNKPSIPSAFTGGDVSDPVVVANRSANSILHYAQSGNWTGGIKITLPGFHSKSNWSMLVLRVTVYEYNGKTHTMFTASGHDWTSGWYNKSVKKWGSSDKNLNFGYSSSADEDYLLLGEVDSAWSYGHITVDVIAHPSFYSGSMNLDSGWKIEKVTSYEGITRQNVTNEKVWDSGNLTNNSSNWDTAYGWGNHANKYLPLGGGSLTGATTITVGKAGVHALNIRNTDNGGGASISFSDMSASPTTQHGVIDFKHSDTSSYGSGAAFIIGSDQANTTILADGKLMYKEGIYSKPSSGTGAGTRKDSNWDTAYSWGNHASEGYLKSLPSHNHDDRYFTETEMRTFFNRGYIDRHHASNLAVGWYTIATNTGDRALGEFQIWDTASSDHQSVLFSATHHFGQNFSNDITITNQSRYSGTNFRYIRIKDHDTYAGAALQVYIDGATNSCSVAIVGANAQESGWVIKDWIADDTDPGDLSNWDSFGERTKVDLDLMQDGGILTTGKIFAGSQTDQKEVVLSDTNLFAAAGHSHSNYITSNANDTFTGTITMGTQKALVANNYGRGVYGLYSAERFQHVWSMGVAYNVKDDGTTPGNLYGLAFSHNNAGGETKSGLAHQLLIMDNGKTKTALGRGIWTDGTITTTGHGNSSQWNTAYGWGNHADAGYVKQAAVNSSHVDQAKGLSEQGFGTDELTFQQTANGFANYKSGWAHYIISNHGNGQTYYNVTDIRPFWGAPQYSRQEGTEGVWKGPYTYWTEENFTPSSYSNKAASETLTGSKTFSNSYNEFGNGHGSVSNNGSWNARVNIAGSSHARLDVKSVSDGIITTMFAHIGQAAGKVGTYSNHKLDLCIAGTTKARLETSGIFRTASDIVAYYSFSDRRLKTNIESTENNLEKILALNPVSYQWKEGDRKGRTEIGLIAQEVEEIIPEVVREQGRLEDEDITDYKTVDYEKLVSTLIGAIQEQQKEIDILKNQMKECHGK